MAGIEYTLKIREGINRKTQIAVREVKEFLEQVADLFDDNLMADATILAKDGVVKFSMAIMGEDGLEEIMISRNLNLDRKNLYLDLFVLDEKHQGKGLGKKVHKLQYELAKYVGVESYGVLANIDVGGYAWLKYGMKPESTGKLAEIIVDYYERKDPGKLKEFRSIWESLDDKGRVRYVRENLSSLKPAFMNSDWRGGLDLTDEESVRIYEAYINSEQPPAPTVDDYLERQVVVERAKAGLTKDYEKLVLKTDEAVRSLLAGKDLTDRDLQSAVVELRKRVNELYQEQYTETMSFLREMYSIEEVWASETLFNLIPYSNFQAVLKNPIQATGELLEPFVKDLSSRQIKRIGNAINVGRSQGETIDQIVRRVRGTKARNFRDGVIRKGLDDARTVVRTAVQHAATQARMNTWGELDVDEYDYIATLDRKTSDKCKTFDQIRTFKIGKGPIPPVHPNCRSTIIPHMGKNSGTRSSVDGYVSADTGYYDWLKTRSPEFQDFALGKTKGKLFRDGGLSAQEFADLQLDKKFEPLTLDEMRKLKPNAFKKANI